MILCKNRLLSQGKTTMPNKAANEHNHYALVIVKGTAGCIKNQGT